MRHPQSAGGHHGSAPSPLCHPERSRGICGPLIHKPMLTESALSPLSSRPERTRISCHAALDKAACAPFCKGKAHELHQRHQVQQEIRGSGVEGSAVPRTFRGNVFQPGLSAPTPKAAEPNPQPDPSIPTPSNAFSTPPACNSAIGSPPPRTPAPLLEYSKYNSAPHPSAPPAAPR
jgi:hypothetical protein